MLLDSLNGQSGDQVTLLSPKMKFPAKSSLVFLYHMHLKETDMDGALSVYTYTQLGTYDRRLLVAPGNAGESWNSMSVCIPEGEYRLAFVGTVGIPSYSDIAVDNIEIRQNNSCHLDNGLKGVCFVMLATITMMTVIMRMAGINSRFSSVLDYPIPRLKQIDHFYFVRQFSQS